MPTRPSIRQLEYAVALADELHFGRAARKSAITQPALSTQIRELEELLGLQLFERGSRRVLLTPAGARVLEKAREALRAIDELVERAKGEAEPLVGELRLGVIPTVAPYLLPPLLPTVRRLHPRLRLLLREEQTARLLEQLVAGTLDVVLLALPVEGAELAEHPLLDEPFWFVARADHPLARARSGAISEHDLAGQEVILLEDGHCLRAQALDVCRRAGAKTRGSIQATSLNTLVQMVANGLGTTLLPERALAVELRRGAPLVARRFRAPPPHRTIGLAWRKGAAREPELLLLTETLRGALASRERVERGKGAR
jgi:LysR family hydrogen peroxide-inducible transcriptional activator